MGVVLGEASNEDWASALQEFPPPSPPPPPPPPPPRAVQVVPLNVRSVDVCSSVTRRSTLITIGQLATYFLSTFDELQVDDQFLAVKLHLIKYAYDTFSHVPNNHGSEVTPHVVVGHLSGLHSFSRFDQTLVHVVHELFHVTRIGRAAFWRDILNRRDLLFSMHPECVHILIKSLQTSTFNLNQTMKKKHRLSQPTIGCKTRDTLCKILEFSWWTSHHS